MGGGGGGGGALYTHACVRLEWFVFVVSDLSQAAAQVLSKKCLPSTVAFNC